MSNIDRLFSASIDEIKRGYIEEGEYYSCLLCGEKTEKGIIYQEDKVFYDAEKFIKIHIGRAHKSVFEYLIGLDKKFTGLSEHQSSLLSLFYEGKSDAEVQKELGIGSSSTIRNHRFVLKEKERQAKAFLVLMELLKGRDKKSSEVILPHKTAKMVDDRYNITTEENEKLLMKYFPDGLDGRLKTFYMKEKSKLVVLRHIAGKFTKKRTYTEKEVNEILKSVYEDFATIRRYLIEYGFMDRKPDGSSYWLCEKPDRNEEKTVDERKEMVRQYEEKGKQAGVYQIRNMKNQKVLVITTPDFQTMNGKRFTLQMGVNKNKKLQEEWKEYGEGAFDFEVLEVLEERKDGFFDMKDELKKLERKWLEKLQPYGDRGYNKKSESK